MNARRPKPRTAREYLRVSEDRSGHARSVEEQHDDNVVAAGEQGWTVGEPYRDVNRSASRHATKTREGFDALMADLTADTFDADVLLFWEHSRGSRRVSEWVLLLELLEERGVLVHITTHNRTYDPANKRDRRSLLEDSVDSEYESGKISERTKRAAAASAAAGRPTGRTPWGYVRRYDPTTRKLVAQEPDPETAPFVRELFDRINQGHSLRSIARDWSDRGVTNRSGKPFSSNHLRLLALTHAYVGDRVHRPGGTHGTYNVTQRALNPGTVTTGQWEPLVDRATFRAVQDILTDPSRNTRRPGRGIHLLSMIARCDACGGPLAVAYHQRGPLYVCQRASHVRILKANLDDYAEAAMLRLLAQPEEYRKIAATEDDTKALREVRDTLAGIRAELDDLAKQLGRKALSPALAGQAEKLILARLHEAEEQEKALATPHRLRGLIEPGPGVEQRWEAAPMSTKREVARLLLSPEVLGELRLVRLAPRSTGSRQVPARERVRWAKDS